MGFRGNMKKRMSRANESGARVALIVGDEELAAGEAMVKDLVSGTQERLPLHALPTRLAR
jgi:histidyl-tRNA synthetase